MTDLGRRCGSHGENFAVQQFDDFKRRAGIERSADTAAAHDQFVRVLQALARYRKYGREFMRRPRAVNPRRFNLAT